MPRLMPYRRTNARKQPITLGRETMKTLFDSIVRTLVPIVVGVIITWATTQNITLDPEFEVALTAVVTGAFSAVYYVAVRLFETYVSPKFGWLLGLAKTPEYTKEG